MSIQPYQVGKESFGMMQLRRLYFILTSSRCYIPTRIVHTERTTLYLSLFTSCWIITINFQGIIFFQVDLLVNTLNAFDANAIPTISSVNDKRTIDRLGNFQRYQQFWNDLYIMYSWTWVARLSRTTAHGFPPFTMLSYRRVLYAYVQWSVNCVENQLKKNETKAGKKYLFLTLWGQRENNSKNLLGIFTVVWTNGRPNSFQTTAYFHISLPWNISLALIKQL